jgi:hypothetical protein
MGRTDSLIMPCGEKMLMGRPIGMYDSLTVVLGGEIAVPCTRNPLQRGLIPLARPLCLGPLSHDGNAESLVLRGEAP